MEAITRRPQEGQPKIRRILHAAYPWSWARLVYEYGEVGHHIIDHVYYDYINNYHVRILSSCASRALQLIVESIHSLTQFCSPVVKRLPR